jgi:hypothetical protein
MDSALEKYQALLNKQELGPFHNLTQELAVYWKVLEPVLLWNSAQRRERGYAFLRDEVFPRRTAVLHIADQIARINESQLNAGREKVPDFLTVPPASGHYGRLDDWRGSSAGRLQYE